MRIIYYSYYGTYAAYTMAALHTGIYLADSLPSREFVTAQYELCRKYGEQTGNLLFVGLDDQLREVYTLGCGQHSDVVIRAISNLNHLFDIEESVSFISAEKLDGWFPGILQRYCITKKDYMDNLFYLWFKRIYSKCLKEVLYIKESLKDGILL